MLVIAGMFIGLGAGRVVGKGTRTKAQIRRFSTLTKKLHYRAQLDNKTYRLVFDLPSDKSKTQSYWVESTGGPALLLDGEQRESLERNLEEITSEKGETIQPDPQGFVPDSKVLKQKRAHLPEGLFFKSIELEGNPIETLSEGRVYIYFFPQRSVQTTAIHLTDRKQVHWTLILRGIHGRVEIFNKQRDLKDFVNP